MRPRHASACGPQIWGEGERCGQVGGVGGSKFFVGVGHCVMIEQTTNVREDEHPLGTREVNALASRTIGANGRRCHKPATATVRPLDSIPGSAFAPGPWRP